MATKKELEARIASLEAQVAHLLADRVQQQPVIINPAYPVDQWWHPQPLYPTITCTDSGGTTLRAVSSA